MVVNFRSGPVFVKKIKIMWGKQEPTQARAQVGGFSPPKPTRMAEHHREEG